jgi:hypothetical protein
LPDNLFYGNPDMSARQVHVINHPLVQHKLTLMRRKDTSTKSFRELVHEISAMLAYEITRDMPTHMEIEIETPLEPMKSRVIDGKKVVLASILRAGKRFSGRHAQRHSGVPASRPHRPLPRPRHPASGGVLLQDATATCTSAM